ncbi:uncharacterized protein TRIREDRAFT_106131 [Trichoderma reesei QM6a]|jgi:hypothetical protein|uniref:Predicted protein n=1 Tax=Hypocrea jecorina (strain QM6a) TaxID=431241 RepID=G0RGE5_HYPJQ|nr:uncharacterized protein TRIREDRAFT_106131 [Trichoderma reesei QM6a]EGR49841.1 predicted protein [Trichoderma reesei QM6a]
MSDNIPTAVASSLINNDTTPPYKDEQQVTRLAMCEEEQAGPSGHSQQETLQQQKQNGQVQQQDEDIDATPVSQNLREYLSACHSMTQAAQSLTLDPCASDNATLAPEGKVYPQRIVPSPNFMEKQRGVWSSLMPHKDSSLLQKFFPSIEQVHNQYFAMEPINGRMALCVSERMGTSSAVITLLQQVMEDAVLKKAVGLEGKLTYGPLEGDPALSAPDESSFEYDLPGFQRHCSLCVYSNVNSGRPVPAVAIEYRPSDLPLVQEVTAALAEEITPLSDVIGKEDESFTFDSSSKQTMTAIITQLYDCMVRCGVTYGYVYTGVAIIFLEIQEDPSVVHCFVSVPDDDVSVQEESGVYFSAVGQIFAFMIRAMQAGRISNKWRNKAVNLDVWRTDYGEVLLNMPPLPSPRSSSPATSDGDEELVDEDTEYDQDELDDELLDDELLDDDVDEDYEEESYVAVEIRFKFSPDGFLVPEDDVGKPAEEADNAQSDDEDAIVDDGRRTAWIGKDDRIIVSEVRRREYCTQECLLGLTSGAPLDTSCPNIHMHGDKHLDNVEFLKLVQEQLALARGTGSNCIYLQLSGSMGDLFKVTLATRGYTFVVKAVMQENVSRLLREGDMYTRLKGLQGGCIPVYLGILQLTLPFQHDAKQYTHFMLLSWAGRPVKNYWGSPCNRGFVSSTQRAYTELHDAGIIHRDAKLGNMLYNPQLDRIMLVDFERSSAYRCRLKQAQLGKADGNDNLDDEERNRGSDHECDGDCELLVDEVEHEDFGNSTDEEMCDACRHTYGSSSGGLRRVSKCENLRKEFEAASGHELSRAVNVMSCFAHKCYY